MVGITGLFYILAFFNQYLFQDFYLPFAINVVAGALPFFVVGRFIARDERVWHPRILISIFAIACLSGDWTRFLYYEMKYAVYGFPILSALVAVGGYFCVFAIADLIQSRFFFRKPLAIIGRASMTIMYLHMPILIFLKSIGWTDTVSISLFAIAATTAVHWILSGNAYTEKLFLGGGARSVR
jgi:peptidoglycan/LPS O-acetylase OafA/YrhL